MLLTASPHTCYYLDHCSQQNVLTSDEIEWAEWAADGQTRKSCEGKWNTVDTVCFSVCPYWQGSPDYFKVWVKINELIVYQESIYLKESEIGKAIFSLCTKVSCVMQLAMTTKLMALCSQSQWVWSRPNTWIKCYTWCPTTSLQCEVHPHFISHNQWLTFIHYIAYITGWLSDALITHGL